MSTTTTTDTLLGHVGASLVAAEHALERCAAAAPAERVAAAADVEQALVQLACVAGDAVAAWEAAERDPEHGGVGAIAQHLTKWRGQLDDLRVQAALAEMELRDSPHHALAAVEQSASAVEKLLVSSVRDVGAALGALRAALRPTG
jgi:hypothetical protein